MLWLWGFYTPLRCLAYYAYVIHFMRLLTCNIRLNVGVRGSNVYSSKSRHCFRSFNLIVSLFTSNFSLPTQTIPGTRLVLSGKPWASFWKWITLNLLDNELKPNLVLRIYSQRRKTFLFDILFKILSSYLIIRYLSNIFLIKKWYYTYCSLLSIELTSFTQNELSRYLNSSIHRSFEIETTFIY